MVLLNVLLMVPQQVAPLYWAAVVALKVGQLVQRLHGRHLLVLHHLVYVAELVWLLLRQKDSLLLGGWQGAV
jgi:hypothetical protein